MARHRHITTEEQEDPKMDISSMIDCCFLLLIYFLVATTLVSEKKLDISIPGSSTPSGTPPQIDPGNIKLKADGSVYWNGDEQVGPAYNPNAEPNTPAYTEQRRMPNLVNNLTDLKANATNVGVTPVVIMVGSADAPHQRVVDIMAALAEAGIVSVGLNTMPSDD